MKNASVDVCQPCNFRDQECKELEDQGYILTGQLGGGDIGSRLLFSLPENPEERVEVERLHSEHMARVQQYHDMLRRMFDFG